jgi:hypothetical protein
MGCLELKNSWKLTNKAEKSMRRAQECVSMNSGRESYDDGRHSSMQRKNIYSTTRRGEHWRLTREMTALSKLQREPTKFSQMKIFRNLLQYCGAPDTN